ncbi:hypothetical protein GQ600_3797 [Phytophthora cactorum]|nr:hypothetical protein GQ600_3797 [Phytophthora cactorum]
MPSTRSPARIAEAALDADTEADSEKLNNSDAEDSSDTAAELDSEASDDAEAANLMEVAVAETFVEIRVQIAPILTIVLSLKPKNPPSWKPLGALTVLLLFVLDPTEIELPSLVLKPR